MAKFPPTITTFAVLILISSPIASAQNPPQTPQPGPAMMAGQPNSKHDQQNFPQILLQQLSAIKAAALNDDYGYRQLTHLTENIGPRPTGSPPATGAADNLAAAIPKPGL